MQIKGLAVMCARQWLIGCALVLGGSSAALAASMENQDISSHVSVDSNSRDGGGSSSSSGDVIGLGHDGSSSPNSGSSGTGGNLSSEGPHHNATDSAPLQRASLGWQSLLPGSIQ
jgi:hypothetical protein